MPSKILIKSLFTGLIFVDLRKALGTISHCILLSNLDDYGVGGPANQLIRSFLNRRLYVLVRGSNSDIL